ncbi:deoxyribose-phosphate aldolase [Pseudidiomarina woesei]|uniref:Deoxyribose-phosphate aldolase n=1 Tax=Pseudidiomarina woesei TaxID=1381080 RepID=A0A0K6HBX7_9GAMM|nr:deoxyribose-phosphate aldolase [Pseudidiomarina woesei]CUA88333.1 deoxyribose-phosphate aldolase [Pseudidiomarina woesei]
MTELDAAKYAIRFMDLTSLNNDDTPGKITQLCELAKTPYGSTAAVCVFPEMVVWAKLELARLQLTHVKVATVTNFPNGSDDVTRAAEETARAVAAGADEVDVVFPWRALKAGNTAVGHELVSACKTACGDRAILKVIIESGELATPELITTASNIAIRAGADFIKTSTGKVPVNATLEAADLMLHCIKQSGSACGFKAAGGVRTASEAQAYLELAESIMGSGWLTADNFRFGASSLLKNLTETLAGKQALAQDGY